MIYKNGYFLKELDKMTFGGARSRLGIFSAWFFAALLSAAAWFAAVSCEGIVLPDYISFIYLYKPVFCICLTIVLVRKADRLTYAEIKSGRFYLLGKNGYSLFSVSALKMLSAWIALAVTYSGGFALSVIAAEITFAGFSTGELWPVFFSGLSESLLLVSAAMLLSVFIKSKAGLLISCVLASAVGAAAKFIWLYYPNLSGFDWEEAITRVFDISEKNYLYGVASASLVIAFAAIKAAEKKGSSYSR